MDWGLGKPTLAHQLGNGVPVDGVGVCCDEGDDKLCIQLVLIDLMKVRAE